MKAAEIQEWLNGLHRLSRANATRSTNACTRSVIASLEARSPSCCPRCRLKAGAPAEHPSSWRSLAAGEAGWKLLVDRFAEH